jgi:hypothetical protein
LKDAKGTLTVVHVEFEVDDEDDDDEVSKGKSA